MNYELNKEEVDQALKDLQRGIEAKSPDDPEPKIHLRLNDPEGKEAMEGSFSKDELIKLKPE